MGKQMRVCAILLCVLALTSAAMAGNYIWTQAETAPSVKFGYLKAADGAVYIGGEQGLYRSDTGGLTWSQISPLNCYRYAVEGTTVLMESNEIAGYYFYRSTNKGDDWTTISPAWTTERGDTLVLQDGVGIFGTWQGLYISNDAGVIWANRLYDSSGNLRPLSGAAQGSDVLAGLTYSHPGPAGYGGIMRSTENGDLDTWSNVVATSVFHALAFDGTFAVGQGSEGFYHSFDSGETWARPADVPGVGNLFGEVSDFIIADETVFAANGSVSFSLTQGAWGSWGEMNSGLPMGAEVTGLALHQNGEDDYTLFAWIGEEQWLYRYDCPRGLPKQGWDIESPSGTIRASIPLTSSLDMGLALSAFDAPTPGGVGVTHSQIQEFRWTGTAWDLLNTPTWADYSTPLTWPMLDQDGVHAFVLFLADANGNVSNGQIIDYATLIPSTIDVAQGSSYWFFVYNRTPAAFTITVTPTAGDPDLYWWAPSNSGWSNGAGINYNLTPEVISPDVLEAGFYTFEIYGYQASQCSVSWSVGGPGPGKTGQRNAPAPNNGKDTQQYYGSGLQQPEVVEASVPVELKPGAKFSRVQSIDVSTDGYAGVYSYNFSAGTDAWIESHDASFDYVFQTPVASWVGHYLYDMNTGDWIEGVFPFIETY